MITNLRKKFIAIIAIIVGAVLLLTMIVVLAVNYNQNAQRTKEVMRSQILSNTPGPKIGLDSDVPCVVFVMRGETLYLPHGSISEDIISNELLIGITPILSNANYGYGSIPDYKLVYLKQNMGLSTYIAVADDIATKSVEHLFWLLLPIMLLAEFIIFIISIFFSKWAVRPIEENLEQQKHFITNVSHDLKTPITVMMANDSILQESATEEQKQWIESNQNEANKMLNLVNSMLDVLKAGIAKGKREKINLSDIIKAEALSFESVAFDKSLEYKTEIDKDVFINTVKADIAKLVATLIDNAFKHAENDDTITVTLKSKTLCINNRKTLIDSEDLHHLFDRFYTSDKSRSKQGHGLGLAICAELANKNNAKISVTSTESEGTTFTVNF